MPSHGPSSTFRFQPAAPWPFSAVLPDEAMNLAMKLGAAVIALSVVGEGGEPKYEAPDGWSIFLTEMHWSGFTKFHSFSYFLMCVPGKERSEQLSKIFHTCRDGLLQAAKAPELCYPFQEQAGMRLVTDFNFQLVPQVGSELTFYIQRSKKLKTTVQLPPPSSVETVYVSGPWDGVRQMLPEDFVLLCGYSGERFVNLHFLSASFQRKFVAATIPCMVGELMIRCAAEVL